MEYFASLPVEELLPKLVEKIKKFNLHAERSGKRRKWEKSHKLYFGEHMGESGGRSTSVEYVGDQGELTAFGVNYYRNLIKHTLAITTAQKPSYDPVAKNTDLEAIQQARLGRNIIDAYMTEKRMGRHMLSTAERSLVYCTAYTYMTWEPSLGRPYSVQQIQGKDGQVHEKVIYEGDVEIKSKAPFDVIFDHTLKEWTQNRWVIVREWENKWDLIARYPDKADALKGITANGDLDMRSLLMTNNSHTQFDEQDQDLIPVYHFYHSKGDAIVNGRYSKFVNAGLSLYDGPIQYNKRLPVFRMTPGEMFDSADGYSDALDIMVLQEVVNTLYSTVFTNQQAFGTQVIWMPDGCEIAPSMLGKGLAVLKGGPPGSQPIPLQLMATPGEIFKNIEVVKKDMTMLMGLNSVVTGDPEHGLKSGAALGRMQAMAIQYSSNFQKAWGEQLEDCGTFLFELLHDFAKTERMVALVGKHNKGAMSSFTGQDLDQIERVSVDLGNPLQNTAAGRIEMADNLLAKGAISAKQYIQVATSGNLETATEAPQSQEEFIRKENESLMDGKPVRAMVGDAHIMHSQEHMTVLNDPMLRSLAAQGDQGAIAVVQATTDHINEHKQLHETQDPFWTMLTGEPLPPPPPQGPPPGPGGPPDGGPPPQQPPNAPPIPPPPGMGPQGPPPIPPLNQSPSVVP